MAALNDEESTAITDEGLTQQIQPFLDEWFYRILHSPVGKTWSRTKALGLLMDILGMIGINVPADQRDTLLVSDADEPVIAAIIAVMPGDYRAQFEATALQIQTVLHEATRILTASEEAGEEAVTALFDEAGSDRGGLTQTVLKASVVHAAKEVAKLRQVHTSWRKNTDQRIDRLLQCTNDAEHAQQQLMAVETQLDEIKGTEKAKSKGLLLSMAEGKESALVHAVFSGWEGYVQKCAAEKEIRQRFQKQIDDCKDRLTAYKAAQMEGVKGVLMRGAMEDKAVLMNLVWKAWVDEVKLSKNQGDTAADLKAAQDKLDSFEAGQKEKATQFMTRMASGSEDSLKNLCLEAWIKFHKDYAADMEMEEKVKDAERKFKEHMDAKKDEAKAVLDRMSAGSDTGLKSMIMQNWATFVKDEKKQAELEFQLAQSNDKFKSLNARQKAGVNKQQNNVNEQINLNLLQRVMNNWITETKANRVEQHYNSKYDTQLYSATLFLSQNGGNRASCRQHRK
jgi:hypothetical protein